MAIDLRPDYNAIPTSTTSRFRGFGIGLYILTSKVYVRSLKNLLKFNISKIY